jgi:hypothetical protein
MLQKFDCPDFIRKGFNAMSFAIKVNVLSAAMVTSFFTLVNLDTAQAESMCIDVNQSDPRGPEGKGRNAIMWKCHGGKNQDAKWLDRIGSRTRPANIVFNINGKSFCLSTLRTEPTGASNAGFNVIAWPVCSKEPKWFKDGDTV